MSSAADLAPSPNATNPKRLTATKPPSTSTVRRDRGSRQPRRPVTISTRPIETPTTDDEPNQPLNSLRTAMFIATPPSIAFMSALGYRRASGDSANTKPADPTSSDGIAFDPTPETSADAATIQRGAHAADQVAAAMANATTTTSTIGPPEGSGPAIVASTPDAAATAATSIRPAAGISADRFAVMRPAAWSTVDREIRRDLANLLNLVRIEAITPSLRLVRCHTLGRVARRRCIV